jgi:hypothetical protein
LAQLGYGRCINEVSDSNWANLGVDDILNNHF